ncbi:YesL family protein [Halobacillus sp. Marseille-Q1614]|uniref:YesL family protein n=1 Tax=Halobacillus sp. Marseille-Q1614 TaxID=2709134 RepID=UPI00156D81E2|nr:YesL family protein [Halobacillus sp. Marseille-Q1614]
MLGGRLLTGVLAFCNWVTHFALLNLLWIVGTLMGGIVLGLAPSTVAMYTVSRKQARGEENVRLAKTFFSTYRKEFFRANGLALILTVAGWLCFYDLQFFQQMEGPLYTFLTYVAMAACLTFIILLVYILPVYVHYDLKLMQMMKQALFIGFLKPSNLILMIITSLSTYYFFISFPGFIPLFGFTIFAHLNMWMGLKCFETIEEIKLESDSEAA